MYDGSKKMIYLDGVSIHLANDSGIIDAGEGYNLLIGAGRDDENPTLLYDDAIDEVRIYNFALSAAEVNSLYILDRPSCSDNIMNGDEEGIDCGGPCSVCTIPCVPTEEICDGLDNNCDGFVDENLVSPLLSSQLGVCSGYTKSCNIYNYLSLFVIVKEK